MPVECELCQNSFSTQGNLYRHMRGTHNVSPDPVRVYDFDAHSCKCLEGCNVSFMSISHLRKHLQDSHSFEFEEETYMFDNIKDFELWLENISNTEKARYVKRRLVSRGKLYYYCSRSGKYEVIPEENRKRKSKKGTSKINAYCTSVISVSFDKSIKKYLAHFYKTHYGHSKDVKHLRLLRQDRLAIAKKLHSGLTSTEIMQERSSGKKDDTVNITGADIRNIRQSLKSNGYCADEWEFDLDELLSKCKTRRKLLLWKTKGYPYPDLETSDFCVIFMSKEQENLLRAFASKLICIDSTFDHTDFKYHITSLMVFDDFGEELPAAFMLTNRRDTFITKFFLAKIKEKLGCALKTNIFIGDVGGDSYTSWESVMGPTKFQLFSPWHVFSAWKCNLKNIPSLETIHNNLKILQMSNSEAEFHFMLEEMLELLSADEETEEFCEYFKNYFYGNSQKWAHYYYEKAGITSELHLELLHGAVESYMDNRSTKTLLNGIEDLLNYERKKIANSIVKNSIDKKSEYLELIEKNHYITSGNSYLIQCVDDEYKVSLSEESDAKKYTVREVHPQICCNLICTHCQICIHRFSCSCFDYLIDPTICEHIHCIIQAALPDVEMLEASSVNDQEESLDVSDVDGIKDEIRAKCKEIMESLNDINNEFVLNKCLDHLKKMDNSIISNGVSDEQDVSSSEDKWTILEVQNLDHNYCN